MKKLIVVIATTVLCGTAHAQDIVKAATKFINSLSKEQQAKTSFPFDTDERYNFHFFPKDDRKGISIGEMNASQRDAAWALVKTCLSEKGTAQAQTIMSLEAILKRIEKRGDDDHYRDPQKYFFSIYGIPDHNTQWGWRVEGHHLSYTFSADHNRLVSGTPAFTGSNPGIVPEGESKGLQALKEQADLGYTLLASLDEAQLARAVFDEKAPGEIITFVSRKAAIEPATGIRYSELKPAQQQLMLSLINSYIDRYTKTFAGQMKKELQEADLGKLSFSWAGSREKAPGNPHYFRIQGPTIIIEYDNTQNNGNHVHSVLRDLNHDFGDLLADHYKKEHQ